MSHILSGCKVALEQGRYTYRHDNIMVVIVKCLRDFLDTYRPVTSEDNTWLVVNVPLSLKILFGILHKAHDGNCILILLIKTLLSRLFDPMFF